MGTNLDNIPTIGKNITTIEELGNNILNDPEKSELFRQFIESKYGLESKGEILNVTEVELEGLKKELELGKLSFDSIGKKVYQEYLETSLEVKGLKSLDFDILTQGEESYRILEIKNQFEGYFDEKFSRYDFISNSQKELFKISIANKLINSKLVGMGQNLLGNFEEKVTNVSEKIANGKYSQAISHISNTTDLEESGDIINQTLNTYMDTYISKFDSIQLYIQKNHPNLNSNQLQNVFSNIESFKNPIYIENNIDTFDIKTVDFTKVDVFNSGVNVDNLKQYILQSKDSIQEKAKMLSKGDKVQEMVLDLILDENFGGAMKGFLGFLMELPIVGNIISSFLGLDQKDPIGSLEKLSSKYNFFNGLISQGKIEKNEGIGVFKNINFGNQGFQENKSAIEDIMSELPQLDGKGINKFWQDGFSEKGYQLKGVYITFQGLDNTDNYNNGVLKQGVLNKILHEAVVRYKNDKGLLELEQQQLEKSQEDKKRSEKIDGLNKKQILIREDIVNKNTEISLLSNVLNYSQMSTIDDWDDWFNIGDITDVSLLDIKNKKTSKEALILIESNIGEKIEDSDKKQVLKLSELIIEYLNTNNLDKNIKTIGDLYKYSSDKSKGFFDYVSLSISERKSELQSLTQQEKNISQGLEKLGIEKNKEEKIASSLLYINEGSLSDTIKFGEYNMKYNSSNGELKVGDLRYIIYFGENIGNNFSNIIVNKGTIDFSIYGQTASVNKMSVIEFLSKSIINKGDINVFESGNNKITLKKQVI